jgi:hypothetical protein
MGRGSITAERWITDLLGRPICLCGGKMDLARIEPHSTIRHAEIRKYECSRCNHTLIQTFGDDK